MKKVVETDLPGVGVRFDLETGAGRLVGVVAHRSGRRDLVIYDHDDPDRARESVELSEDEGHTLGELLGGSPVLERLNEAVQRVNDLVITWITVEANSPVAGLSLAEMSLRAQTGAGVVAVVAERGSVPVPGGEHVLLAGDTAVVVGLPGAVEAAQSLLSPSVHKR